MSNTHDETPKPTSQQTDNDGDSSADVSQDERAESPAVGTVAHAAPDPAPAEAPAEVPPDAQEEEPLTPEEFAEEIHWHDMLLALLVVLLALLLSFFKISNMELWRHLRTGQSIVEHGVPERDIFSYTADQRRWINPHWLFAVGSYQIQRMAGFKGLVAAKVLAVVLMTLLLLSIRHRGPTLWWTAITTAAALVILNKQFQVSPELFTYSAVSIQLAVLFQAQFRGRLWLLWLLVPLQVLWVNVDLHYYIGLAITGLTLVGLALERLMARRKQQDPEPRRALLPTLAVVFAASFAACWINPYDLRDPAGVALLRAPLEHHTLFDKGLPQFGSSFPSLMSLFDSEYWADVHGWDEYGTLLFVLLALVSFGMNWRRFRWSRFFLLAGFLVLCALLLEHMYLLALVSVVVLALNGQEWFLDRYGTQPRIELGWLVWSRGGRVVTVLSFVTLFLLGASGRLRSSLGNDLGLGVEAQVENTFAAISQQLSGLPETARGFNFNRLPHQGNLLIASAYPDSVQKVFLDDRLELYRRGRPQPNTVTAVDLAALPSEVSIATAGKQDETLSEKLDRLPTRVDIPLRYEDRFWYDSGEGRLMLHGSLSQGEFEELLRLISLEDEELGLPVPLDLSEDYGESRRAYVRALRRLYARSRVAYDPGSGKLSIRGVMSPHDQAILLSLNEDEAYREAVRTLFDRAQDLMITYLQLREVLFDDDKDVWGPILDKYGITYLTLELGPPPDRFGYNTFVRLSESPNWEVVTPLSGTLALFIRTDVKDQALLDYRDAHRLDFQELAYREDPSAAPLEPAVSVQPHTWYFDALWRNRYVRSDKLMEAFHYQRFADDYLAPTVDDIAAFRFLTIRRLREALLENPGNPVSYLMLADAYQKLLELEWQVLPRVRYGTAPTALGYHNIRYYQLVAALNQALAAQPDLLEAHEMLVQWYYRRGYLDLMLRHYKHVNELLQEDPENGLRRLGDIAVLEKRVKDMRARLAEPDMARALPLTRAQSAFENGFPELALEELGGFSGLAPENDPLYVRLCLETGQHEKAVPVLERLESNSQLLHDGQWEQLMGTVRLLQGNYDPAAKLWNTAIQMKEYRAALDVLHGSGLLMRGLQSPQEMPGLWQGYGPSLIDGAANLLGMTSRERSTSYAWLGMTYLETPYANPANEAPYASQATQALRKALEVDPDNPLRPVIVYYLTRLTGEKLDPFGPAEYIQPEFSADGPASSGTPAAQEQPAPQQSTGP